MNPARQRQISKLDVALVGMVAGLSEELGITTAEQRSKLVLLLVEVHTHGGGLRLQEMIDCAKSERKSDFSHDIAGIWNHWDPVGNKFRDCFSPRFAKDDEDS